MKTTLQNMKTIVSDGIHKAMLIINTPTPATGVISFERLRLSNAFKGRAKGIFDQNIDSFQNFGIGLLPIQVLFPGKGLKN